MRDAYWLERKNTGLGRKTMQGSRIMALGAFFIMFLFFGCISPGNGQNSANTDFAITFPPNGWSKYGFSPCSNFQIEILSNNITIGKPGNHNSPNQGHFRLYLVGDKDRFCSQEPLGNDGSSIYRSDLFGEYYECYSSNCTIPIVPGKHTVKVELRNTDGSAHEGIKARFVTFTAIGAAG